jgi:hypothetical protein
LTNFVANGFARPYAQAVAGEPTRMQLKRSDPLQPFELCWQPKAEMLHLPTEIYASPFYYPGGPDIIISPHVTTGGIGVNYIFKVYSTTTDYACVTLQKRA